MRRRQMLEFAVLGLLHEAPMHGYELRRRLNGSLGAFRALSFGTLYPALRRLLDQGWIVEDTARPGPAGRRPRITYALTDAGRSRFAEVAQDSDPSSWEDEGFDVRVAFFARTEQAVRLRILQGRRARLEERLAAMREHGRRGDERADTWTAALQRHGEETIEREMRWLDELVAAEQRAPAPRPGSLADPNHPAFNPGPVTGRPTTPSKENPS